MHIDKYGRSLWSALFILLNQCHPGGAFAGDLPEKDAIIQKDTEVEVVSADDAGTRTVVEFDGLNEFEMEIMQEEILLIWSEMTLGEKVRAVASMGFWVIAWIIAVSVVSIGAPIFLYLAVLTFLYANFTGAMALGNILL